GRRRRRGGRGVPGHLDRRRRRGGGRGRRGGLGGGGRGRRGLLGLLARLGRSRSRSGNGRRGGSGGRGGNRCVGGHSHLGVINLRTGGKCLRGGRAVRGLVVVEEIPPRAVDTLRIAQELLVDLVHQPLVRAELGQCVSRRRTGGTGSLIGSLLRL